MPICLRFIGFSLQAGSRCRIDAREVFTCNSCTSVSAGCLLINTALKSSITIKIAVHQYLSKSRLRFKLLDCALCGGF